MSLKKFKEFILNSIDYNTQKLFHILTNLEQLAKNMNSEKNENIDLQKSLGALSDSKKIMEKIMKVFFQKMLMAEQSALNLQN